MSQPEQTGFELARGLTAGRCSPIQEWAYRRRERFPDLRAYRTFRILEDFELIGPLDVSALRASVAAIIRRHANLRSAIHGDGEAAHQTVLDPPTESLFDVHDLRRDPTGSDALLLELYQRPLTLEDGRGFRIALVRVEDDVHRLVAVTDHVLRDGRSSALLHSDLFTLYPALAADPGIDPEAVLPPLRHTYLDWAQQQWRLLDSDRGAAVREFWARRLDGAADLVLPDDQPSEVAECRAHLVRRQLAGSILSRIDTIRVGDTAREEGASELLVRMTHRPITLMAVLFATLHRLTGQTDLCIVMPADSRTPPVARVVGHFVVPLILRVTLDRPMSFRDLIAKVRRAFLEAHSHRSLPLYAVHRPRRELWRVAFNYMRQPSAQHVRGIEIRTVNPSTASPTYLDMDMQLFCLESATGPIDVSLLARDLFRQDSLGDFLEQFVRLADRLLGSPEQLI